MVGDGRMSRDQVTETIERLSQRLMSSSHRCQKNDDIYVKYKSKVDTISFSYDIDADMYVTYIFWMENLHNFIPKGWGRKRQSGDKSLGLLEWTVGNSWATASKKQADKISRGKHGRLPGKS